MFRRKHKVKIFYQLKFWLSFIFRESCKKVKSKNYFFEIKKNADLLDNSIRVNYYNKLSEPFKVFSGANIVKLRKEKINSSYFYDFYEIACYFPSCFKFNYLFGDVKTNQPIPTLVKSRPISEENFNSIILPLNTRRHFIYHFDKINYEKKIDKIIWRGAAFKEHRIAFLKAVQHLKFCDVGATNLSNKFSKSLTKKRMSIEQQLQYKFILSIEGNDVASNLKWILNSNSVCFMPKPKYETWFMEGTLIENYHYVLIQDDFSDVEEKYLYYIKYPEKAKEIILNANRYCKNFFNIDNELNIARAVLIKYASLSKQLL
jgi:hypothetical protein